MQLRKLGKDGPEVGAVGLGCMSFAGAYGKVEEAEAHRTLAAAIDLGVTHLDTALIYGNGVSESYIGSFIKDHRNRFTIATKAGIVNLAQSLRSELWPQIDVRLVTPGFVRTPLTDKNDFAMPGLMEPEQAADRILKGLDGRSFEIAFPRRLIWPLKLLGVLPHPLAFAITSRMRG